MIRINLIPTKKKGRSRGATSTDATDKRGVYYLVAWLLTAVVTAGILYWLYDQVVTETAQVNQKAAQVQKEVDKIKKLIDEERLQQRKAELERIKAAQKKVEAQRRTPVYVMYELANILTSGREPDFNTEEYRQCQAKDPNCALDPSFDGQSIWLDSVVERAGGALEIKGSARDAADLSEFVKRMRVSARFTDVTHPQYTTNLNKNDNSPVVHQLHDERTRGLLGLGVEDGIATFSNRSTSRLASRSWFGRPRGAPDGGLVQPATTKKPPATSTRPRPSSRRPKTNWLACRPSSKTTSKRCVSLRRRKKRFSRSSATCPRASRRSTTS